jgi:hypothetical protein
MSEGDHGFLYASSLTIKSNDNGRHYATNTEMNQCFRSPRVLSRSESLWFFLGPHGSRSSVIGPRISLAIKRLAAARRIRLWAAGHRSQSSSRADAHPKSRVQRVAQIANCLPYEIGRGGIINVQRKRCRRLGEGLGR